MKPPEISTSKTEKINAPEQKRNVVSNESNTEKITATEPASPPERIWVRGDAKFWQAFGPHNRKDGDIPFVPEFPRSAQEQARRIEEIRKYSRLPFKERDGRVAVGLLRDANLSIQYLLSVIDSGVSAVAPPPEQARLNAEKAAEKIYPECLSRTCFMKILGTCWGCDDQKFQRERATAIILQAGVAVPHKFAGNPKKGRPCTECGLMYSSELHHSASPAAQPPICPQCGYDPSKWVTIGTIKMDIEKETTTFERAQEQEVNSGEEQS